LKANIALKYIKAAKVCYKFNFAIAAGNRAEYVSLWVGYHNNTVSNINM
jgi:hypothetical protein